MIDQSEKVYNSETIQESLKIYEKFVVGSDQIWNPSWYNDGYLLNFVNEKDKKISYAASIGRTKLNEIEKLQFQKSLMSFKAVSVREESSVPLLLQSDIHNVKCMIDPVLLLNREEWDEIASVRKVKEEYLFYYFLTDSKQRRKIAKDFAKKNNLKIIIIQYLSMKSDLHTGKFADYSFYDSSPKDFVGFIKHASWIFTDSFHVTVFSNIYSKKFISFGKEFEKESNSRIENLLVIFKNENHFCKDNRLMNEHYTTKYFSYQESDQIVSSIEKANVFLSENLS